MEDVVRANDVEIDIGMNRLSVKRSLRHWIVDLFLLALVLLPSSALAAPQGSVKLSRANLKRMEKFYCGKLNRAWVPGRVVAGYFYSNRAEISNLKRSLKSASSKSRAKIKAQIVALDALMKERSSLCVGGTSSTTTQISALKFDFRGAKGIVLADRQLAAATFSEGDRQYALDADQSSSNLRKVTDGGALAPLVTYGKAQVSRFIVAPNDKLYVYFRDTCINATCSERCVLGEVDISSGNVACVDKELQFLVWNESANSAAPSQKPIQFDSAGNLYYMGTAGTGMTVLRKYNPGTKTREDLINQNITINGYLVLSDGSVLLAGYTQTSGLYWLRKRRADGSIAVIASSLWVQWMGIFPDGRVYVASSNAVQRMRQDAETLDAINWLGGQDAYNRLAGELTGAPFSLVTTSDNAVYALSGMYAVGGITSALVKMYPVPHMIKSAVHKVQGTRPLLSDILVYGTDKDGYGKLTVYNTKTGDEQDLLGSNKMEVYRVEYLAGDNAVQFDGQRFSDGKYVLCTVYLSDNAALACTPTGSIKLADFQSLSTPGVRIPPPAVEPTPIALLSYDFNGATALWGSNKIATDGSASGAALSSYNRSVPVFESDNNQLWLVRRELNGAIGSTFYLTDQEQSRCNAAQIARSGGRPICALNAGNEIVSLIRSKGDGSAYLVTYDLNSKFYHLYFYAPGAQSQRIDSWTAESNQVSDAIITSSGHVVILSSQWIRTVTSRGERLLNVQGYSYRGVLSKLPDGRILVTDSDSAIRTLAPDGTSVNPQRYSYYYYPGSSQPYDGEVQCSVDSYYACQGAGALALISTESGLFSIHGKASTIDTALFRLSPGPVSEVVFSKPLKPVLGTAKSNMIFVAGSSEDGAWRVMSHDLDTGLDQDLTDDPALKVRSMSFIGQGLYMVGTKPTQIQGSCDVFLALKTLGGGTAISKINENPVWCDSGWFGQLIKF